MILCLDTNIGRSGLQTAPPIAAAVCRPVYRQRQMNSLMGVICAQSLNPGGGLVSIVTYCRYQIMLRARRMAALSQRLAVLIRSLTLPEDVTLASGIDPVALM
jgi:hypothetical protein